MFNFIRNIFYDSPPYYCSNCHYFQKDNKDSYCIYQNNIIHIPDPITFKYKCIQSPQEKNKDNKCNDYKKYICMY